MVKVVNRILLIALCGVSLMCGAYLAKGTPKVDGQISTTIVEQAPTEEAVSTMHRGVIVRNENHGVSDDHRTQINRKDRVRKSGVIQNIKPGKPASKRPSNNKRNR